MKTTPIPVKFGREGHPCNFSEGLRAQPRERPRAARAHLRASALRVITGCGAPADAVAAAPLFPPLAPMVGGGRVAGASIMPRILGSARVGGAQDGMYLRRFSEETHRPSRPFFFVAQQVGLPLPPGVPGWSERFGRPRASASTLRNQRKILMTQYAPIGAYQLSH